MKHPTHVKNKMYPIQNQCSTIYYMYLNYFEHWYHSTLIIIKFRKWIFFEKLDLVNNWHGFFPHQVVWKVSLKETMVVTIAYYLWLTKK
jgi:hypothetical protein